MTYKQFIDKLRVELKDFGRIHQDSFDGDGATKNFACNHVPIKDDSYVVKIGAATQTETTHYTINKDTGVITFVTEPTAGSDNITISYQSLYIRDEDYIELINDGINHFRWKLWTMGIDTTTLTSVKDQYEYDCSGITDILYLTKVEYKSTTTSDIWNSLGSLTNFTYYTRLEKLAINPTIQTTGLPMRVFYLKAPTKGTATNSTLDISTELLLPYKYYVYARFYERMIPEKIGDTSAVTTNPSFTPAQSIFNIASMYYEKADKVATKIAPRLPNMPIHQQIDGRIA